MAATEHADQSSETSQGAGERSRLEAVTRADGGYRFTLEAALTTLEAEPSAVEGPRGTRMHIVYGHDSRVYVDEGKDVRSPPPRGVRGNPGHFDALFLPESEDAERRRLDADLNAWQGSGWSAVEGKVLSGTDFLQVRADGVIELDGRVTLRANDGTLIDATYRGLIDLEQESGVSVSPRQLDSELARSSPAYKQFVTGTFAQKRLPVRLFITFDTSTGPWSTEESEDATWTKPSQARHRRNVWKYAELTRRQYLAVGTLKLEYQAGRLPKPEHISVDVYDVAHLAGGVA